MSSLRSDLTEPNPLSAGRAIASSCATGPISDSTVHTRGSWGRGAPRSRACAPPPPHLGAPLHAALRAIAAHEVVERVGARAAEPSSPASVLGGAPRPWSRPSRPRDADELRVPRLQARLGFSGRLRLRVVPRRAATAEAALLPRDAPIRSARVVSARSAVVEIVVVIARGRLGARAVPLARVRAVGALPVLLPDLVLEFFDLHREVRQPLIVARDGRALPIAEPTLGRVLCRGGWGQG